jgi:large subunit ribosomal protein L21
MYAIVKTGGKQYRVQEGQTLLIERLPVSEGDEVALPTLLIVDGETLLDGDQLKGKSVVATITGHPRGPKLRVVKFKPKRGYKRRNGHRQDLTEIRIKAIGKGSARVAAAKVSAETSADATVSAKTPAATAKKTPAKAAAKPAAKAATAKAAKPKAAASSASKEATDGS